MKLTLLLMIFLSFNNIFADTEAYYLFLRGNQRLDMYYKSNNEYNSLQAALGDDSLSLVKEGLELLISSGIIYFNLCQQKYNKKYLSQLCTIDNTINVYINLVKSEDKEELMAKWNTIRKYLIKHNPDKSK